MVSAYITGGKLDVGHVEEITRVKDVSIKSFPCPTINNEGLTGAWWWADKIALAISLWAAAEQWKSAKEEYNIGKDYYNLAKEQWDLFYAHYRPLEEQELAEIWAEKEYVPDYPTAKTGHTGITEALFANAKSAFNRVKNVYCMCDDVGQMKKADILKSITLGDSDNYSRRYAEKLAQTKNDIRWDRRITAVARGRNLLKSSLVFASRASDYINAYGKAMGGLATQAQEFRGYINNRLPTTYTPSPDSVGRIDGMQKVPHTYRGFDAEAYWENRNLSSSYEYNFVWGEGKNSYTSSGFDPTGYVGVAG